MPEFTPINTVEEVEPKIEPMTEQEDDEVLPKVEDEAENSAVKEEADDEESKPMTNGKNGKGKKASPKSPTTPRKRGRKPAAEKGEDATEDAENDESPSKKKRPSPKSKATTNGEKAAKAGQRALPTSYESASPEDKMLLRMKDVEGKPWAEIREAWETMTGDKVGGSTLSGRYTRIKANFVVLSKDDESRLVQLKKEIEDKFENEKWTRLADAIEQAGGGKYPAQALQKKFKELTKKMSDVAVGNGSEMAVE